MTRMKRIMALLASLFVAASAFAQVEQIGYVKTRGRMINGVHVPGKGLSGAVVSVKNGNSIGVHESDGSFSFPVRGGTFTIKSVSKKDYVLVDADALPKTYAYSSNPVYLVMETPDQLLEDQLEAESRIRRTLQRQLDERKKELEEMKAQAAITQEEYRTAMLKLYEEQGEEEILIRDMARRYSEIDYDQLDDFYRQVSVLIELGELSKVDSLLRSRGDLNGQIDSHLKRSEAIRQKEDELRKAKDVYLHDMEEMARRCYSYYENFYMSHQRDSAAHYLQLRAKLDTANVLWQSEAGGFVMRYLSDYELAGDYYERALDAAICQNGESHPEVAMAYNNIGMLCQIQGDNDKALEYFNLSLKIRRNVYGDSHPDVGRSYNNIGTVYHYKGDYAGALDSYQRSLEILSSEYGDSDPSVATLYNNIGEVLYAQRDYSGAFEAHMMALDIRRECFGDIYPDVGASFNNIGSVYYAQGDYVMALEYLNLSLNIRRQTLGSSHPDIADTYSNIGSVYQAQGDYSDAMEYYNQSLEIMKRVHGDSHPSIATLYNNIGMLYFNQGDYANAVEYQKLSLEIREQLFGNSHQDVIVSNMSLGLAYLAMGEVRNGLSYLKKACELAQRLLGPEDQIAKGLMEQIEILENMLKEQNHDEVD